MHVVTDLANRISGHKYQSASASSDTSDLDNDDIGNSSTNEILGRSPTLEQMHSRNSKTKLNRNPLSIWFDRCRCCDCCKKPKTDNESSPPSSSSSNKPSSSLSNKPIAEEATKLQIKEEADKSASDLKKEDETSSNLKELVEKKVAEECIDATVNKMVNNLSWVNATLLVVAITSTLYIDFSTDHEGDEVLNAWILLLIMYPFAIILTVIPRFFEDTDEIKRELDLKKLKKEEEKKKQDEIDKIKQELEKQEDKKQLELNKKESGIRRWSKDLTEKWKHLDSTKMLSIIKDEGNDVAEKFEDLFSAILSNTVSMAWRDALKGTMLLFVNTDSGMATVYFFYALFMTIFGIYLIIRIGNVLNKKEREIKRFMLYSHNLNDERSYLWHYAFQNRSINLTQEIVKYAIAWSWRDCVNAFIKAIYGTDVDGSPVSQQWGYFFLVTTFISVAFSFSDRFHFIYPRRSFIDNKKDLNSWLKDKSRLLTNEVLYHNFRFVVGMALFDALMTTLKSMDDDGNIESSIMCLFYWIVSIVGITTSTIGTHYTEKWELRKKIAVKGLSQALFDWFERSYDPEEALHEEGDEDFVPVIVDTTCYELVYVTVFGLGIAGSMSLTNAIKYTINEVTSDSDADFVHISDVQKIDLLAIWLAFFIVLIISTIITAYLSRMVAAAREVRRHYFDLVPVENKTDNKENIKTVDKKNDDKKEEEEEEPLKEQQKNNVLFEFGNDNLGDSLDSEEIKIDDDLFGGMDSRKQLEEQQKEFEEEEKKKDKKQSRKAEDEGYADHGVQMAGDDDAADNGGDGDGDGDGDGGDDDDDDDGGGDDDGDDGDDGGDDGGGDDGGGDDGGGDGGNN